MPLGGTITPEQLVQQATGSLFCIDWAKISFDLLNNNNPNPTEETHRLARRCKPGEIDWFISHSWRYVLLAASLAAFRVRACSLSLSRARAHAPPVLFKKGCTRARRLLGLLV